MSWKIHGENVRAMQEEIYLVSLKRRPVELVIENATVFNSITAEFLECQNVWVKNGTICYVGIDEDPVTDADTMMIDVQGKVLLPGLIEGHTHILNFIGPEEFIRHVIPSGTTTVVTETIELASVAGQEGFDYFIKALQDQPIRLYYTISPMCGLTLEEEVHSPPAEEYHKYLRDPLCLGLGEIYWANMLLENEQGERVRKLAEMALSYGKLVEGHTAGASPNKLQAYTSMGVSSCHEPINGQEVIDRLRLGYWVMIRQGAIRQELDAVAGIFSRGVDTRRVVICTDSMDPERFINQGSLDAAVRRALELGVPPEKVYQSVTINVAEHFRLDNMLGSISPGKKADMVIIPEPGEYRPEKVICDGKLIFEDSRVTAKIRPSTYPEYFFNSVKPQPFDMPPVPQEGKVRVMDLVTRLVTTEGIADLDDPQQRKQLNLLLAIERTGRGGMFLGMIKGLGLKYGAAGTTMCWDTSDMFVAGCDEESIRAVVDRLEVIGGGAVVAVGSKILAEYPARLCGIVGLEDMETAWNQIQKTERALAELGVPWEKPILTLNTLGTAAIPHLRITHHGYVRLRDRAVLALQ